MDNQKLIERVRKLLALSDQNRNSSESEALAALDKAQSLIAEHGLSMSEIELQEKLVETVEQKERLTSNKPAGWIGMIYRAVYNDIFNCRYYQTKDRSLKTFKYVFVVTKSNLELAEYFCSYIIRTINDISDVEMYKYKKAGGTENGKTWRSSFCFGCAGRIIERLEEKYRKSFSPLSQQHGLMRIQKDAVEKYLEDRGLKIRTKQSGTLKSADGYFSGRDQGNKIGLHDSLNSSKTPGTRMLKG